MDFTRKARWVLDGHKSPDPVGSKYAGVVSRESVRIAFTYAALNALMCAWQTSGMPIYNHQHLRSTTLSVDQSLGWKMLARWQSCIEQFMVGRPVEENSGTTLDHAWNSSMSHHVLLILMFG